MKLIAYVSEGHRIEIRPAPLERDWMEATDQRYAYRCLPLNIANAHGWEILCPSSFTAEWNGGPRMEDIEVRADSGGKAPAISHFAHGVLTFHIPCLFRTEQGYDLIAQGPVNRPKDGIASLTGVIETDWAPYSFTMNWLFTRPGTIRFEAGEPFCHIFPVRRGELDAFKPQIKSLSEEPDLQRQYEAWTANRGKFIRDLKQPGSEAQSERWQKLYYRGMDADGEHASIDDHRTRQRLKPFAK